MPSYYCPKSNIKAYEVVIDPEFIRQLNEAQRRVEEYLTNAIQNVGNLQRVTGAGQLQSQLREIRQVPYLGIRFGALARPIVNLQARINTEIRRITERSRDRQRIQVNLLSFESRRLRAELSTISQSLATAQQSLSRLVTTLQGRSRELTDAIQEAEDTAQAIERGMQYEGSLIDGAAQGILVEFYDGSVYYWDASSVGDATIDHMIELGEAQAGLGTFIYASVRFRYSSSPARAA